MIDDSLLKTNFIGRDGFRWWLGQVAPFGNKGGQGDQNNGGGWGNRVKVRIIGYHPFSEEELSNEELPFAHVMLPTTAGTGAGGFATPHNVRPSDTVFGFFLDGDDAQQPVIIGALGRTSEVSQNIFTTPFRPYTGHTGRVEAPDGTSVPNETNETNTQSQKSPRMVDGRVIKDLNKQTRQSNRKLKKKNRKISKFWEETSYYNGLGAEVTLGNSCQDTGISGIISLVSNLVSAVTGPAAGFLNTALEITKTVSAVTANLNGIVGNMFSSVFKFVTPLIKTGLGNLFNTVFSTVFGTTLNTSIATLAGALAQGAFLAPIKFLQDSLFCGIGNVLNDIVSLIEDLLKDTINNAANFVACAGYQFVGSLINSISKKIQKFLGPALSGISALLGKGLDILDVVTNGIDAVAKVASIFDCNQSDEKCEGMTEKIVIGKGVVDYIENVNAILKNARISQKIGDIVVAIGDDINDRLEKKFNVKTEFPDCDTKIKFKSPKIRIFGGGTYSSGRGDGSNSNNGGGKAIPVMGEFVKDSDGKITGSIVGVKITDPGKGYKYPPFIEIDDPSGTGYGAFARAIIDPSTGILESIYMVSIGENYPTEGLKIDGTRVPTTVPGGDFILDDEFVSADDFDDLFGDQLNTVGIGSDTNIGISSIVIVNSGSGYSGNEILVDSDHNPLGFGNTFIGISTDSNGGIKEIIAVEFNENNVICRSGNTPVIIANSYPEIRIKSDTGSGALLRPSIGTLTTTNLPLVQIIDCI